MLRFSGDQLRCARRKAGLRPEQLAVKIDRSVASLAMYERGEVDPPASIVGALAEALHVVVDELYEHQAAA